MCSLVASYYIVVNSPGRVAQTLSEGYESGAPGTGFAPVFLTCLIDIDAKCFARVIRPVLQVSIGFELSGNKIQSLTPARINSRAARQIGRWYSPGPRLKIHPLENAIAVRRGKIL